MKGAGTMNRLVSSDGYPIEDERNSSVRSPFVVEERGCVDAAIAQAVPPDVVFYRRMHREMVGMQRIINKKSGEAAD